MANPSLQLLINGVDLSAYTYQDNWEVDQNWGKQGAKATFTLYDEYTSPSARHFALQPMQAVTFKDNSAGVTLFTGFIVNPMWKYISPNACEWYLDCRDFTYFADQTVVTGDFTYQTADNIIKQLTAQANLGITTNHVQRGIVVPRYRCNYKPLSTAWSDLATLASGQGNAAAITSGALQFGWYIDSSHDLHWYNASQTGADPTILSGVTFTDTVTAPATATTGYIDWDSTPQYEYDGQNLRNSCIVRGGNIQQTQSDYFVGNGQQQSWPFTFALLSTNPHFKLTGNGAALSIDTVEQAASRSSQPLFLAQQAQNGQWFMTVNTAAPGAFIPAPGVVLKLTYNYEAPVVARVDDRASQNKIRSQLAAGGIASSGVFQKYVADKTIKDQGTAQQRAQRELQEYSLPQERFTFDTSDDWPGTIRAGQIFTVSTTNIPDSQNHLTSGFTKNFLAQTVSIKPSQGKGNYRKFTITGIRVS